MAPSDMSQIVTPSQEITDITNVTEKNSLSHPCNILSHPFFTAKTFTDDLDRVCMYLLKGGAGESEVAEIRLILTDYYELVDHKRIETGDEILEQSRREFSISKELDQYLAVTTGDFSVTDCYNALQAVTKRDKASIRQILHRLAQKKILKKHASKAGIYRVVDSVLEEIDWLNADDAEYPLILPLGLHNYVKTMKKNLIVIAGEQNAGKTAFLLNVVKYNMYNNNINYFSSEMSENEFKSRILKFSDPSPDKWKFNAYNRCSNFADVINPDGLNIIDFLELHDEFWKVGSLMKDLYEKLNEGIAIIAIQKDAKATVGRGGAFGLEKPRLYINMSNGTITIRKGKNWRYDDFNPNGLSCDFKLVQGSKFIQDGRFYRQDDKGNKSYPDLPQSEECPY